MSTRTDRWTVPAVSVGIGVAMCLAVGLNGTWWLGFLLLGIMVVYAAVLLLFRGTEAVALLGAEGEDERRRSLQTRAGYFSVNVVAVFVVAGFVIDLARGGDGMPWAAIAAVGGFSFMGGLAVLSRRG